MNSTHKEKVALATREARLALLEVKTLVDSTAEKIHAAELEAVGHPQGCDPLKTLRIAAEALQAPNFEAAISQVRSKLETAVAWHRGVES